MCHHHRLEGAKVEKKEVIESKSENINDVNVNLDELLKSLSEAKDKVT